MVDYIAHVCLNSKLPPQKAGNKNGKVPRIEHPDFCERGFIDESPNGHTGEQCWKYCKECEAKGYPIINIKNREKNIKRVETGKNNMNNLKIKRNLIDT
jgi:hypothetical protein